MFFLTDNSMVDEKQIVTIMISPRCFACVVHTSPGFVCFGQKINWFVLLRSVRIAQNLSLISFGNLGQSFN